MFERVNLWQAVFKDQISRVIKVNCSSPYFSKQKQKRKTTNAPLLGQRSGLLYWKPILEGLSCALEPHLLLELDPLPFRKTEK